MDSPHKKLVMLSFGVTHVLSCLHKQAIEQTFNLHVINMSWPSCKVNVMLVNWTPGCRQHKCQIPVAVIRQQCGWRKLDGVIMMPTSPACQLRPGVIMMPTSTSCQLRPVIRLITQMNCDDWNPSLTYNQHIHLPHWTTCSGMLL